MGVESQVQKRCDVLDTAYSEVETYLDLVYPTHKLGNTRSVLEQLKREGTRHTHICFTSASVHVSLNGTQQPPLQQEMPNIHNSLCTLVLLSLIC